MGSDQETDPQGSDTNLMRNGAGLLSSWLERGGSLGSTDAERGGIVVFLVGEGRIAREHCLQWWWEGG